MKKLGIFGVIITIILAGSSGSLASLIVLDLEAETNLAPLVLVVKCNSVAEREATVRDKPRKLIDYKVTVEEIVKKDMDVSIEAGKEWMFTTFAPQRLVSGGSYIIFLKSYTPEIMGFVGGDQGVFKKEGTSVKNKFNNRGLFQGVKKGITGPRAEKAGLKAVTKDEALLLDQAEGPIETTKMIELIRRIDKIKKSKGEQ